MAFWTYIMASESGTLYIGSTDDLVRRAWQHKHGLLEGFSKDYGCSRLVYYEQYQSRQSAFARERQLDAGDETRRYR
jgi:putative endonuclease